MPDQSRQSEPTDHRYAAQNPELSGKFQGPVALGGGSVDMRGASAPMYKLTFVQSPEPPRITLQKPLRVAHFIGREKELEDLLRDLQPGRVITLCGPGGMGKTALAAEAIWRLAPGNEPPERFPDGIISFIPSITSLK